MTRSPGRPRVGPPIELRITQDDHEWLQRVAAEQCCTMASIVRRAIRYLRRSSEVHDVVQRGDA